VKFGAMQNIMLLSPYLGISGPEKNLEICKLFPHRVIPLLDVLNFVHFGY